VLRIDVHTTHDIVIQILESLRREHQKTLVTEKRKIITERQHSSRNARFPNKLYLFRKNPQYQKKSQKLRSTERNRMKL